MAFLEVLTLRDFAVWGYGFAAFIFVGFTLYLYAAWRGTVVGGWLLAAVILSCFWVFANLWLALGLPEVGEFADVHSVEGANYFWPAVTDVLRGGGWFIFLLVLLRPVLAGHWVRFLAIVFVVLCLQMAGIVLAMIGVHETGWTVKLNLGGALAGAVLGLALIEQLWRGMPPGSRWGLKPLCLGLGAAYIFDLYLFSDAFLFGRQSVSIWLVRGPAHALVLPLVALSGARNPAWAVRMSLSRSAVFHSTALGACGLYLLVVSAAGYWVRARGGDWGQALQMMLLFVALVLMAVFLSSSAQRARLKVFLNKHLFPYRYDYRVEWLRFTRALAAPEGEVGLGQSAIAALANLVESPGGMMWLRKGDDITIHARLNHPEVHVVEHPDSSLVTFMREREWVIDLEEYRRSPLTYPGLELPGWLAMTFPDAWLLVPLIGGGGLIGFVLLLAPRTRFEVDWEVRDLLKTAQHQAASDLERMLVAEDLLEARKFESFTRMSAFVVHDLKNLVAQLSLMLKNAERHRDNPEFQADMLETVAHVESKMRSLMTQLQEKRSIDPPRSVNLVPLLKSICHAKREQRPKPLLNLPDDSGAIMILAHPERLERVLGHVVQNALEATPDDGRVSISLLLSDTDRVRIVVKDSGCGMSEDFIRERLMRPFETTKANGMGIGVYETRQYLRELRGDVQFDSTQGAGTTVTIELPTHTPLDGRHGRDT